MNAWFNMFLMISQHWPYACDSGMHINLYYTNALFKEDMAHDHNS